MDYFVLLLLLCHASATFVYAITASSDVTLLETFVDKLLGGTPPFWNFTTTKDPCSSWPLPQDLASFVKYAGLECQNCPNNTCHITKIYIVGMDVAGQIAPEIGNFTSLQDINLAQNILTGPIPKEIFKLDLLYLSLGKNKLSGTLPSEIGSQKNLISLGISLNKFSGLLPKEIGNLTSMTGFYFDDNEFEGEIPREFAGLILVKDFFGNNNHLNGSIPDIFANMTSLSKLRLFGNKFEGKIPSTVWNLTNLEILYMDGISISNLSMPSSLVHMKNLTDISFRDCGLTGMIPTQIGDLTNLDYLDLSFNNFTDGIPSTFGSLTALSKLFLGSNHLSGELPEELQQVKNSYMDLSYNQLSGPVPTWLNTSRLNLNWNFFDTSKSKRLAATLFNCLDAKSNCTRVTPGKNVKFSINCGGPQIGSYDDDLADLEYASVNIHRSKRWAVSNTGYVITLGGNEVFDLISTTNGSIDISTVSKGNSIESSIYQTSRSSPISLRYFGLDMVNGSYSLELHFAEIAISANNSQWQSTGKRLFDIYIQGEMYYKDFDIVHNANGSFKAFMVKHTVQVTQGVLDIHFKWSEDGTCCIPKSRTFGPLISAIVVTPEFHYSTTSKGKIIGISISILGALILMCLVIFLCWRRHQQIMLVKQETEEFKSIENKPDIFTYNELKIATKGFRQQNLLGEGGFGSVYKGTLPDGTIVAVKKLTPPKSNKKLLIPKSTRKEFINEVCVISSVKHRNLVKLLGCCIEGDHRILVLEFLENNSLEQALLGPPEGRLNMAWPIRYNICVEVAKGIAYLHEESIPRIIHRDIKASNILLDKNLQPKIADFGLAKLLGDDETHISTKVAGTIGYLSPEYATRGQLSEKLDVYSFGVLALEIISGRSNLALSLPQDKIYLLEWVMELKKKNSVLQVIDLNLGSQYSKEEAITIIEVAILCTQASPNKRPTMSNVVNMLNGSNKIMAFEEKV